MKKLKKELLIITKKELKEIIKDAKFMKDNAQFTIAIEKRYDYFHITE